MQEGDDVGPRLARHFSMTKGTRVVIYRVDDAGGTGARVGRGSLVDPMLVLVHPPLSDRIAQRQGPRRLRVGIVSPGEDGDVEVIDIEEVHSEPGPSAAETLVGLELKWPASAPTDEVAGIEDDRMPAVDGDRRDAIRTAALEHVQGGTDELPTGCPGGPPPPEAPWCYLFGVGCGR
jgi:hypothetical protein